MKTYLGDAVYADFDVGSGVLLSTSDTNTIYLEPAVLDALFFLKRRVPINAGGPIKTALAEEAIAAKPDREIMNMTDDRSRA